jgi:hypothetical protein
MLQRIHWPVAATASAQSLLGGTRCAPVPLPADTTIRGNQRVPAALAAIGQAADVRFNGDRPWDLLVHTPQLYSALLRRGSLALGDGYVRGDWDCDQLDELICRLLDQLLRGSPTAAATGAMPTT